MALTIQFIECVVHLNFIPRSFGKLEMRARTNGFELTYTNLIKEWDELKLHMHIFINPAYLTWTSPHVWVIHCLGLNLMTDDSLCTQLAMKGRWATVVYSGLFMKWSCLAIAIVLSGLRALGQADVSVVTIICLGSVYRYYCVKRFFKCRSNTESMCVCVCGEGGGGWCVWFWNKDRVSEQV